MPQRMGPVRTAAVGGLRRRIGMRVRHRDQLAVPAPGAAFQQGVTRVRRAGAHPVRHRPAGGEGGQADAAGVAGQPPVRQAQQPRGMRMPAQHQARAVGHRVPEPGRDRVGRGGVQRAGVVVDVLEQVVDVAVRGAVAQQNIVIQMQNSRQCGQPA